MAWQWLPPGEQLLHPGDEVGVLESEGKPRKGQEPCSHSQEDLCVGGGGGGESVKEDVQEGGEDGEGVKEGECV